MSNAPSDPGSTIDVIVYGDFNCPFSALAHERAMRQQARGLLHLEWRAVEHDPDVPPEGEVVDEETRDQFEEELTQIRELLVDGEPDVLRVPSRRLNTRRLNALLASTPPAERADFRRAVFGAYWVHDHDMNSCEFLDGLATVESPAGVSMAIDWQWDWESFERRIVPMMRLPDGKLVRGLGVLARLK